MALDPNLLTYIKNQKKSGAKSDWIRSQLLNAGWNSEDVDHAIHKIYKSHNTLIVASLIVVLCLAVALVLYALNLSGSPQTQIPSQSSSISTNSQQLSGNSCIDIQDDFGRDLCYQNLIATSGYDCSSILDQAEKSFCLRSLEYTLIQGY